MLQPWARLGYPAERWCFGQPREDPRSRLSFRREKLLSLTWCGNWVYQRWKTRDNGGKAAWLFIGVLSSVYWISDVITDDQLAVLIICACSSRNLFIKHHFCDNCLDSGRKGISLCLQCS